MSHEKRSRATLYQLFEQVAEAIFDYVKPPITLIGEQDDQFHRIQELFTWAVVHKTTPEAIQPSTSLVVVNNLRDLEKLTALDTSRTVVLAYDESQPIPIEIRENVDSKLTSYLSSTSKKFMRSHVRILLQIHAHTYGNQAAIPLVLEESSKIDPIFELLTRMDSHKRVTISAPDPSLFEHAYKCLSSHSSHKNTIFINWADTNSVSLALAEASSIVVRCTTTKDIDQAKIHFNEHPRPVCFLYPFDGESAEVSDVVMGDIKLTKEEAYLVAYSLCANENLVDTDSRTRFVQKGDIDKFYLQSDNLYAFVDQIKISLKEDDLLFKNIPPSVEKLNFGKAHYMRLLSELDGIVHKELFEKINMSGEMAELLSGTSRSSLLPKLKSAKTAD